MSKPVREATPDGDVAMELRLTSKQVVEIELALLDRIKMTEELLAEAEVEMKDAPSIFRGALDTCKEGLEHTKQTLQYMRTHAFPEYKR